MNSVYMTVEEYCKLNEAIEILDKAKADLSYLAGQDGNTPSVIWSARGNVNDAWDEMVMQLEGESLETCSDYVAPNELKLK